MKIKILSNCSGIKFSYSVGDIIDSDEETAKDLIRAGYAVEEKERITHGKDNNPPSG